MPEQFDIAVFENFNGGDVLVSGNDLVKYYENENQVYLALFGGNVAEDTPTRPVPGKERNDYWGNYLSEPENQFNSRTERTLSQLTELSSQGRNRIQAAVEYDLTYLSKYANVTVTVTIVGQNRVKIEVLTAYFTGKKNLTVINYSFTKTQGDFSPLDFSTLDFY